MVVAALVLAAAAFWAGRATLSPAPVATERPASEVVATVAEQTVGRQLNLNVTVTQPKRALAQNVLAGVVTEVRVPGQAAGQGDLLYRVAGVPVRVVQGQVPFHRALGPGDRGADVQQVQDALVALNLLGRASGAYDVPTQRAVRAWQKSLGTQQTGLVPLGEVVAAPTLPASLLLDDKVIDLGATLAGGEKIVYGAVGQPSFVLRLSQQQARLVPESATVTMTYQGRQWRAIVAGTEQAENGDTLFRLTAPDGGPVCGADCALVATGDELFILSQVAVVAPASGPAVPVAAIRTGPGGAASVIVVDATGQRTERAVTVKGSQNGVAVVDGVAVGERVQVLGDVPAPQPTPQR